MISYEYRARLRRWLRWAFARVRGRRVGAGDQTSYLHAFSPSDGPEPFDPERWWNFELLVGRHDAACLLAGFEPTQQAYDHPGVKAWIERLDITPRFFLETTDDATTLPLREWLEMAHGICRGQREAVPGIVRFYMEAE